MFRYISLLLFGAGALHTAMAVKLTLVDNCGGNLKWTSTLPARRDFPSAGTYDIAEAVTGGKVWACLPSQTNCMQDGQGATIVELNYGANGQVYIASSRGGGYNGKVTISIKLKNGGTASSICDNTASDQCFVNLGGAKERCYNNCPNGLCQIPVGVSTEAQSGVSSITITYEQCGVQTSLVNPGPGKAGCTEARVRFARDV